MKTAGLKEIRRFLEEAEKCIRCGTCLYSCPVYSEDPDEDSVARGRNRLIAEEAGQSSDLLAGAGDRFSKCLLCRRCTMVCPQGVRSDLLTVAARADLVQDRGLSLPKGILFRRIMKDRDRMRRSLRFFAKYQGIFPVTRPQEEKSRRLVRTVERLLESDAAFDRKSGLVTELSMDRSLADRNRVRHVPSFLFGLGGGRNFPSIGHRFLSEMLPETNPPMIGAVKRNLRVAFFAGCAMEFAFPESGADLVRVLNQLGVEVVLPKEQGCCGLPLLASGDIETGREMALHNIRVFTEARVDFVVNACATCGSTLKEGWASLLARDRQERTSFEAFGSMTKDIAELIVELAGFRPLHFRSRLPEGMRVTYHDPCHLARYQGIVEQPRKILHQVFGRDFLEMDDLGCCGLGGSFSIEHAGLSRRIGEKKAASIGRTGADVVVTDCPGCIIQITDSIEHQGLPQKVLHLIEVIEPVPVFEDTATFESPKARVEE